MYQAPSSHTHPKAQPIVELQPGQNFGIVRGGPSISIQERQFEFVGAVFVNTSEQPRLRDDQLHDELRQIHFTDICKVPIDVDCNHSWPDQDEIFGFRVAMQMDHIEYSS